MGLSLSLIVFLGLILKILLFPPLLTQCYATSLQPSCHDHERSALLQFKRSFVIDNSSCQFEGDYPKALSWESEGVNSSNCCSWAGINCDIKTGHVIGLNLSGGCLYGSIDNNSTLFHLVHLQKLDLSFNHFNFSPIPSVIGQLKELTVLILEYSFFSGQIPQEISRLSKLVVLSLCSYYDYDGDKYLLKLKNPNLRSLTQNLSRLETLFSLMWTRHLKYPIF